MMRIYGPTHLHQAHGVSPAHSPRANQATQGARPSAQPADRVEISRQAQDIELAAQSVEQAKQIPDIRAERVQAIRQQIEAGTYMTDDKLDLALERLLDEIG